MCGIGFVAQLSGEKSRAVVEDSLVLLERLAHRGAAGADRKSGDGAGILLQLPHRFFKREGLRLGIEMPRRRRYAVGQLFLPRDAGARAAVERIFEEVVREEGQRVLGWRDVPVVVDHLGEDALATMPVMRQVYVARRRLLPQAFERALFVIRKRVENRVRDELHGLGDAFHVASLSAETIVYKGMLLPSQLGPMYPDLNDVDMVSALAVVHSRFSTNTSPTWDRAQPMRMLAHNGEINTLRGNVNWMRARKSLLKTAKIDGGLERLWPILVPGTSDTAHFDALLELLVLGGRSLPHAMMMMIPEAYERDPEIDDARRAFYQYAASLVEPWDGPAAMCFTDGALLGATLDRNGLRPARWCQTDDGRIILASEAGALDIDPARVVRKGKLRAGRMLLVDLAAQRILEDDDVKRDITARFPYRRWIDRYHTTFEALPHVTRPPAPSDEELARLQRAFGYTDEDLFTLLVPMASGGSEPVGSMGNDTPLAVLSEKAPSLFDYFHQLFAQVTNPPIDPLRESLVMSTSIALGPDGNTFEETPEHCHQVALPGPVLRNGELAKIAAIDEGVFEALRLSTTYPVGGSLESAVNALCDKAVAAVDEGHNILILSDRGVDARHLAIPALLALSAVHQRLVRDGIRMLTGLVVESAEVREVHHVAALIGYGAGAVNPWLALDTVRSLASAGHLVDARANSPEAKLDESEAQRRYIEALRHGLLKVMSKMGISTLQSYAGAQIFEAVGVSPALIDAHFTGTPTRIGGISFAELHRDVVKRHARGYAPDAATPPMLATGGLYQFRRDGELHRWAPATVAALQRAARTGDAEAFAKFCALADDEDRPTTLRGLLDFSFDGATPIALDDVEPASEIVKRFVTGAMSFGSISPEAHETLAIAMNRIGARSNSGEGGEEAARNQRDAATGDSRRSAIRQVASGRFGVTAEYLVHADDLQIKIAQGAKPGEGGQLPGKKVDERIARVRHTRPGTTLISPPPHHDIYSIEDLSQLIYDLQSVSPQARISVKLVSAVGVGNVAAGVAKAGAGAVVIAGFEGGTGAAPLSSLRHAGLPWELGLAEAQQSLVEQGLRGRVRVQCDGGIRTPRDVVMAALLGAEELGLATAALVAEGCVMQRKCHLNTCSVGIATQDAALRAKFPGKPEHIITFFTLVAEGVRAILAKLGARSLDDVIGRVELVHRRASSAHANAPALDLHALLRAPEGPHANERRCVAMQRKDVRAHFDERVAGNVESKVRGIYVSGEPLSYTAKVTNTDRAIGARFSGEIARTSGDDGGVGSVTLRLTGSAGQSLGAFCTRALSIELRGEANDFVGKGLCGATIAIAPPLGSRVAAAPHDNVIIGNTALYGAVDGELFVSGIAGERFAVRNSGASAVVEGVGDHACEYMTGGTVVVLGATGRNFAAGMTGGLAFVYDADDKLARRINADDATLAPLADDDVSTLRALIKRHASLTGSPRATALLDNWANERAHFRVVRPKALPVVVTPPNPLKVVA